MGSRKSECGIWRKSSFCNSNDNCVEVRYSDGHISVRDSKDPTLPSLNFSMREWALFISGAVRGEFDAALLASAAGGVTQLHCEGGR